MKATVMKLTGPASPELAPIMAATRGELASIEAGANIHFLFRPSWVDGNTGRHGLRWLVARILSDAGAALRPFEGQYRSAYIANSMRTDEIIAKVRQANGFDKYPDKTVIDLLRTWEREGMIGGIQLTAKEDKDRTSKRPRKVWFLLTEAEEK